MIGPVLKDIRTPTLVVDRNRAMRNIGRMAEKARASNVRFRPHFKTHNSVAIGEWFREVGVSQITVASVDMANYFADHGWHDITIAFPANPRDLDRISDLADRIDLELLVDSIDSARLLIARSRRSTVWIDVDVGYNRTGIPYDETDELLGLATVLTRPASRVLRGLLTHAGHSYRARSRDEIRYLYHDSVRKMRTAREAVAALSGAELEISVGDTPTCSVLEKFDGATEIRPGNFVFCDLQQLQLGVCTEDDLALAVACPVVGNYPRRGEVVVHGGAVHLSRDSTIAPDGKTIFGRIALPDTSAWHLLPDDVYVASISQEHGVIKGPANVLATLGVGDLVLVIPAHACLTANALRNYVTLDGQVL